MGIQIVNRAISVIVIFTFVCTLTSCQKVTRDIAGTTEAEDAPKYTVEFDPNNSPADKK